MSRSPSWVGLTRVLFVVMLAFLIATATVASPGVAAQGPVKDPTLSPQGQGDEVEKLKALILTQVQKKETSTDYRLTIDQLLLDSDWALAVIISVDVKTEKPLATEASFALARREKGNWTIATPGDTSQFYPWVKIAPETIMAPSLREFLLDEYGAGTGKASTLTVANLKLPWFDDNNPQYISGNLYGMGSHGGPGGNPTDYYAQDWSLNHVDVAAVAGGTVVMRECSLPDRQDIPKGYGNYILMDIGGGIYALYAHLSSCSMELGRAYVQGSIVGRSGQSGNTYGAHLHFRLRDGNYNPIRPEPIGIYQSIQRGTSYSYNSDQRRPGASTPSTCTPGANGVVLYEHLNAGRCITLTADHPDFNQLGFNDIASSIQFVGSYASGWEATVYEHTNYTGVSSTFRSNDGDFGNDTIGHDRASSIRIRQVSTGDPDDGRGFSTPSSSFTGTINPANDEDTYEFIGGTDTYVTIAMNKSDAGLDSYLKLYSPSNTLINNPVSDDDAGGNGNALIQRLRLPQTGRYRVVASSYNGRSTGRYTISLQLSTGGSTQITGDWQLKAKHSNKCMEIFGNNTADHAEVSQWDCHSGTNQVWTIVPVDSTYYKIVSKISGKCLDVHGTDPASFVSVYSCHSPAANNQLFRLDQVGSYVRLIPKQDSGQCLDVNGASTDNRARIIQWYCNGGDNQLWSLVRR